MQPSFANLENLISYEKCPCVPHGLGNTGPFYTFTMKTIMFPSIFLENLLVSYIPAPTYVRHVLASTCRCDPSILVLVPLLSCFSHVWLFATPWTVTHQAPLSIEFSRQEYWNGFQYSLLQGLFPTQGSNRVLLHCRQILYCLSHQGRPVSGKSNVLGMLFHPHNNWSDSVIGNQWQ